MIEVIKQMPKLLEQDRKQALRCKHEKVTQSTLHLERPILESCNHVFQMDTLPADLLAGGGSTFLGKKIYHVKRVIVLQAVLFRIVKVRDSAGQWSLIRQLHTRSFLLTTTIIR